MPRRYIALLAGAAFLIAAGIWAITSRPPAEVPATSFPVQLTDDFGQSVHLTTQPKKIVSLAPQHTETLFALERGRSIVGVSGGETHPPQALVIASMMSADGVTPDPAKMIAAGAELVLASTDPAPWAGPLRDAGVAVVALRAASIADALSDIDKIGRLTGSDAEAARLTGRIRSELEEVDAVLRQVEAVPAFVESFYPPLVSISEGGFVHDLLRQAKVDPVGLGASDPKAVAASNPRYYLAPLSTAPNTETVQGRSGFLSIEAVAQGRVQLVDDALLFRPGPRIAQGVRAIARAVGHPVR